MSKAEEDEETIMIIIFSEWIMLVKSNVKVNTTVYAFLYKAIWRVQIRFEGVLKIT